MKRLLFLVVACLVSSITWANDDVEEFIGRWTVAKYSAHGDLRWRHTFQPPGYGDDIYRLAIDSQGCILVLTNDLPIFLLKFDPEGELLWRQEIGYFDDTPAMAVDRNDYVYIVTDDFNTHSPVTSRFGPDGVLQWQASLPYEGELVSDLQIAVDNGSSAYVGVLLNYSSDLGDLTVIKYDPQGREMWAATLVEEERFQSLAGLAVNRAGETAVLATRDNKIETMMFDTEGVVAWRDPYKGLLEDSEQSDMETRALFCSGLDA